MWHQVDEHACDVVAVTVEDLQRPLHVVERKDHDIVEHPTRGAVGDRDALGCIDATPVGGGCGLADLGEVVGAVVGALHLGDLGPPRERPRHLEGGHDGLGSGVYEPDLFKAVVPRAEVFRVADLGLCGHRVGGSAGHLVCDRCDDGRMSMTVDEGGHVVGKVDPLHAIDVGDATTLGVCGIHRTGTAQHSVAAHATG